MPTFAFLDLDGTLVRSNLAHIAVHHAMRRVSWTGRAANLLGLAAAAPALAAFDRMSRPAFEAWFFRGFAGLSEERLRFLGSHAAEHVLVANLREGARDLIERLRNDGHEPVLVTRNLAHVVKPFARMLGIHHSAANRLELRDGIATGRLAAPIRTGANKCAFVAAFCEKRGARPEDCHAYAHAIADLPMLTAVGHPRAVHPDLALLSEARGNHWPVLDLEPSRSRRLPAFMAGG